jgi:membrane associated rhomboid family serine protease
MKLNLFLYRLENKFRRFAIDKLMQIITVCMLIVFGADLILRMYADELLISINSYLEFDRALILKGQVWRVLSFIIAYPESSNILFTLMGIYFFYWTGAKVENYWGKARFTLYYFFGIIVTIIAGLIVGNISNIYLNLSLFLAFCTMFPNERVLILFVIPIKVKWLGIVEAVALLALFIFGYWAIRAAIIAALANYLLFCSYDLINHIKHAIESYKWRKNNRGNGPSNFY